jgi:hippurate hydrolase
MTMSAGSGSAAVVKAAAVSARAPEPEVKVNLDEFTPATLNDVALTRNTLAVFQQVLGEANVRIRPPLMGAEDFGRFSQGGVPILMYFLGTVPQEKWEAAQKPGAAPLPGMHTDRYFPAPEPSIRTGVRTECLAILNLMRK